MCQRCRGVLEVIKIITGDAASLASSERGMQCSVNMQRAKLLSYVWPLLKRGKKKISPLIPKRPPLGRAGLGRLR
jgi:hypothetical protein